MRLIDADALRKNAQHAKDISKWDGELLVVGLGHILNAPTIESPRDWTPCAEGMPEETGKYWVTFFYYGAAFTEKRDYFAHEKRWGQGGNPVAWMRTEEKPEPYNPDRKLAALGANADQKED